MSINQKNKKNNNRTIRISEETSSALDKLLKLANKKTLGSKVFPDQIIAVALSNVRDEDIKKLQSDSLSNEDRKEQLRQIYIKKHGKISRDEFTGFMMTSDFFNFLNNYKK